MSDIHIVREYAHSPKKVWRALTEPALMERWLVAARPEGFSTVVGTRFRFVGKPQPGWSGVVDCEMLEATEPSVLRYSWLADEGDTMELTYRLDPHGSGTRLTFAQTGFKGIGGLFVAKLVMTPVRKKMFGKNLPAVLADLDDEGNPRTKSSLDARVQKEMNP
ncbi:hypothetical protein A7982_12973 [Minicystis rosea]|nr:hypothetical protein A7982_12973 [Minicystis rosea]